MDNNETKSQAFEFLIEEYKELNNSLHLNEERGEKRIEFFLTLSTGVLGAIGLFIKEINCIDKKLLTPIYLIIIFFLIGLILIAIIIQNRLVKRNRTTDGIMKDIREIRRIIKEDIDVSHQILPSTYSAFVNSNKNQTDTSSRKFTSLSHIASVMVCVLIGVSTALILFAFNAKENWIITISCIITLVTGIIYCSKK